MLISDCSRLRLIACALLIGVAGYAPGAEGELLSDRFDALVFPAVEDAVREPGDKLGGEIAWGAAYQLSALADMFDATRDAKYAERIVRLSDWIIAARDDHHGLHDELRDGMFPGWSTTSYSKGQRYTWAVHTGMIVAPMARFAAVVRHDPSLAERWGKDADRLLAVAEAAVAIHESDYLDGPGESEGHLYSPYLKKNLPLNMQNALARAWLAIDDATGKQTHRERVSRLAQFLKNRLRLMEDESYVWAYWPPLEGTNEGFEDVSHAAINVDFIVLCFEHEIVFTRDDVNRIGNTFTKRVLLADDRISDTVGGGENVNKYRDDVLRWARLGRHLPELRERFEDMCGLPEFSKDVTSLPCALALLSLPLAPADN